MHVPRGFPTRSGQLPQSGLLRSAFRFRPQLEPLESRLAPSDVALSFSALSAVFSSALAKSGEFQGFRGTTPIAILSLRMSEASTSSPLAGPAAATVDVAPNAQFSIFVGVFAPAGFQARGDNVADAHRVEEIVGRFPDSAFQGAVVVVIGAAKDAPGGQTQIVSVNVTALSSTQGVADLVASTADARPGAEMTLFVNGIPVGAVRLPETSVPSSGFVQVSDLRAPEVQPSASASVQLPDLPVQNQSPPTPPPGAPVVSTGETPANTVTAQQTRSVPAVVTGTWSGTVSLSPSNVMEHFIAGKANGFSSPGEKDVGLAATAGQRKALALGLRYLNPDMTDDAIAQAVGVSRRTLFRWEEYVTIKKALREVYKRPRGYKDRQGNIEAWIDDDE